MGTVILSWSGGIEKLVVLGTQGLSALRITKYPVLKGFPYGFLFLAGKRGFLFVKNSLFLSIFLNRIKNTGITKV